MKSQVNAIAGRLSLRAPQRRSLEILDRITEIVPPRKGADLAAALALIRAEFPTVTDFEREFPSVCFALATGVGKTRLMGAFIRYLHLAHGINNFFVMAPNLTIYNKLITDFTPNTSKYVFKGIAESRLEDYVVSGLVDFDDVSYDAHADLLYDLAGQVVKRLNSYLPDEHETRKVLSCYPRDIARFVHVQMQEHFWEKATGYEVKISKGFSELKPSAYTASASEPVLDYRQPPGDKSNMAKYLFGGFKRCLYQEEKFQSDTERKLSVILEREASRWFKPAKGQFQIYYKSGADHPEYQPDFVAETDSFIYMLEPKSRAELTADDVIAKRDAAVKWCKQASAHAKTYQGKPWKYLLIPHDVIAENITLEWLASRFGDGI